MVIGPSAERFASMNDFATDVIGQQLRRYNYSTKQAWEAETNPDSDPGPDPGPDPDPDPDPDSNPLTPTLTRTRTRNRTLTLTLSLTVPGQSSREQLPRLPRTEFPKAVLLVQSTVECHSAVPCGNEWALSVALTLDTPLPFP